MIAKFEVQVEMPRGVDLLRMKEYIEESVQSNVGMLHPDDPLFHLERKKVKVKTISGKRMS